ADRGSAILTGAPSHLASALMKISDTMKRIPEQDLRQAEGMNAFFIIPAIRGSSLMELFSTHPSLERRLEQLRKMEMDMERH
ncbi:MAG: M48 family metalloprotease, partial [Dehalococcoidia bacterium]|nr:M48 family metalloprotease [Dehalococcoidia bacterium]